MSRTNSCCLLCAQCWGYGCRYTVDRVGNYANERESEREESMGLYRPGSHAVSRPTAKHSIRYSNGLCHESKRASCTLQCGLQCCHLRPFQQRSPTTDRPNTRPHDRRSIRCGALHVKAWNSTLHCCTYVTHVQNWLELDYRDGWCGLLAGVKPIISPALRMRLAWMPTCRTSKSATIDPSIITWLGFHTLVRYVILKYVKSCISTKTCKLKITKLKKHFGSRKQHSGLVRPVDVAQHGYMTPE